MIKPTPVIFFGGSSEERRVSVASAQNIARTLGTTPLWFMSPDGQIFECAESELLNFKRPFEEDFSPNSPAKFASLSEGLKKIRNDEFVFLLALHGGQGEDGTIQKEFECHRVAFTGSGSASSAKAFDKRVAKKRAHELGIAVTEQDEVSGSDLARAESQIRTMLEKYHDLMAKPVAGGSSIGIFHIKKMDQIAPLLKQLGQRRKTLYLVEPFVQGREITVGVYEAPEKTIALPPSEVRLLSTNDFDYEGKYLGRGSEEITPAKIPDNVTAAVQKIALEIHQGLGCEGYSRTDLILSKEGPVYLETNTLPGLTKASFIPQQLAVAHISFSDFLARQIQIAVAKMHFDER